MKASALAIRDVLLIEPKVFGDERGFFYKSFNQKAFNDVTGLNLDFVRDNHSKSTQNVRRGLHYKIRQPQSKLVPVVQGEVFDIAVDLRKGSKAFGQWIGVRFSAETKYNYGFHVVLGAVF